jgi:hypothetical protein
MDVDPSPDQAYVPIRPAEFRFASEKSVLKAEFKSQRQQRGTVYGSVKMSVDSPLAFTIDDSDTMCRVQSIDAGAASVQRGELDSRWASVRSLLEADRLEEVVVYVDTYARDWAETGTLGRLVTEPR